MMRRRDLPLGLATPLLLGASRKPLIKPAVLRPGDTVGLLTPATHVSDPDKIALAELTARYFGLKPKFAANVRARYGDLGGTVQQRVDDLHALFADPEVKGILSIRGGYGTPQLLDRLDYDLIGRNPKVFCGYSDITALHVAIHQRTGLITFHGPMALARFTDYTQQWFRKALFETAPLGPLTNPAPANPLRPAHWLRAVKGGSARGRLIGGNLSLVSNTMGTPYEIDTTGRIVFLEDVDEQPFRIDRMLTQLRLAGKFDRAAGLIIGECSGCTSNDGGFTLGEVLDNVLGGLKIPVLSGLTIGHTEDQLTLPIGAMATLDADRGQLTIEESATHA